jgi:hypothetical protein
MGKQSFRKEESFMKCESRSQIQDLICPICNEKLRPSLAYGTGYWVCSCASKYGIYLKAESCDWVDEIESIFKNGVKT